jgi:hypothetical protein
MARVGADQDPKSGTGYVQVRQAGKFMVVVKEDVDASLTGRIRLSKDRGGTPRRNEVRRSC